MLKFLNKLANPFVLWLLNSPFHRLLSSSLLLIRVTGRKSGKIYTTPVQYGWSDHTLYVISALDRTWWKNLRAGAQVQVRLRGQEHTGYGQVFTDPHIVAEHVRTMYPSLKPWQIDQFTEGRVAITIKLEPERASA
ncbi:MAG: nitroreductase family deazaflavin-dependent oxidoreductase [Chloroflexi bacterium]|nr:nitroreductase family deazaflavin-dependent oxidoreductase [Chloroflexota bacterium]